MKSLFIMLMFALGACSVTPPPAPTGPWSSLNPQQFQPTQAQLDALPQ